MSSCTNGSEPSETSPLLPRETGVGQFASPPVDPSAGLIPEGADATGAYIEDTVSEDPFPVNDVDGGDVERQISQASNASRSKQHQGLPEVRKRMKYIYPAIAIGVFLASADQTLIVSSYGRIGTDLNALNKTSWIATAYFLTLTSFQPLYGKLSDIFGRKACLLFAYTIFAIGCTFCGLARNIDELVAARAFAGIGGGGMSTVVSILLSDIVTLRERGKWQGYINIIYATGAATGAPLGGFLADFVGWRWAFLFQPPLCVLAFIAVAIVLKLPKTDHSHWMAKLRRIDFLGAIILVGAVLTLLIGLDHGSNVSWRDTTTIASLCSSIPLFCIFLLVETKAASDPFAPGHIIFDRSLFACYLCNFFSFGGWLAAIFYIPLYFQAVDDLTATQAGVRLIPSILAGVSGSLFGGFYMQRTGKFYWITVICYSTLALGVATILLSSGLVFSTVIGIIIGTMISAFSNGLGVTTSLIALIANASHEDQAVATACSYLFRSLGSVFGISMSASVANQALRSFLHNELRGNADADEIAERVRQSLKYLNELEPEVRAIVRECYAKSTRAAFGLQIAIVAGAAISAWFIKEKRLGSR